MQSALEEDYEVGCEAPLIRSSSAQGDLLTVTASTVESWNLLSREVIRDELVPNAVLWYTGEAQVESDDEDEDEGGDTNEEVADSDDSVSILLLMHNSKSLHPALQVKTV